MTTPTTAAPSGIKRRGFASMTAEQRSHIASMGGKAAHLAGTAHQFNSATARAAGRKGGLANVQNNAMRKARQAP